MTRRVLLYCLAVGFVGWIGIACSGVSNPERSSSKPPAAVAELTPSTPVPSTEATTTRPVDQPVKQEPAPKPQPAPLRGVCMEEYHLVETGMSYDEVKGVIGPADEELSRVDIGGITTVLLQWKGRNLFSNMHLTFQNGQLVTKAQFGLPSGEVRTFARPEPPPSAASTKKQPTAPPKAVATPKAPPPFDGKKRLDQAKQQMANAPEVAKKWLREIIEKEPSSDAAKEAAKILAE